MKHTLDIINKIIADAMMEPIEKLAQEEDEYILLSCTNKAMEPYCARYNEKVNFSEMGPIFKGLIVGNTHKQLRLTNEELDLCVTTSTVQDVREYNEERGYIITNSYGGWMKFRAQVVYHVYTRNTEYILVPAWAEVEEGTRTLSA